MRSEIKIEGLRKRFGKKVVFENFNATIQTGRIVGLLGENGVGKTTLLRLMAGILHPDKGTIDYGELDRFIGIKSFVSFLLEPAHFYPWMKIQDTIEFYQDYFVDFDKQKAMNFCEQFGLYPKDKIKTLSKGQQEKVSILLNLSRHADVYLMDEPAGGFDPKFKKDVLKIILSSMDEKKTMILSTHLLKDFEYAFDDVLILKKNKAIYNSCEAIRESGKSLEEYYLEVVYHESYV